MKTVIKALSIAAFCVVISPSVEDKKEKEVADLTKVWKGFIELEQSTLTRHDLNDLPGTVVAFIPNNKGSYDYHLLGNKVLKTPNSLPKVELQLHVLAKGFSKKSMVAGVSYLEFVSANMEDKQEVNLTITETSHSRILDGEIDWDKVSKRIADFRKANPKFKDVKIGFAVLKLASVINVEHQTFKSVKRAGKISGFGFAGNAEYLSEQGNKTSDFIVGIDVRYTDETIGILSDAANTSEKIPAMKSIQEAYGLKSTNLPSKIPDEYLIPFIIEPIKYKGEISE